MNISSETAKRECTSCQMCGAVCIREAITIKIDRDGFYRPYIDGAKCTDCGMCTHVCYKFESDVQVSTPPNIYVRYAQSKKESLLEKVSSGGVADALAKELIKQGFTCIGVTYNVDKQRAEHIVASTIEETDLFRGSKYIQSYSIDAFKFFVKNAKTTKFAIFGLPCHIYAVDKFLTQLKQRHNTILIDLFCHGCPSMLVWEKYIECVKPYVEDDGYDEVLFRSKEHGWGTFQVAVRHGERNVFLSSPSCNEFYDLFFSDQLLNTACSDCKLRSTLAYTDIRLGDFWGKRFLKDKKGVSAVVITSQRGRQVFDAIKPDFITGKSNMDEVIVKQSYGKSYFPNLEMRNLMLNYLRDGKKSLKEIYNIFYQKQSVMFKIKSFIKHISYYLPFDLTCILRHFV